MITVAVISDTHGNMTRLFPLNRWLKGVQGVWYAGDGCAERHLLEEQLGFPVAAVAGNCDEPGLCPLEEVVEVAGKRVLLTHGHLYKVKNGLSRLEARARLLGVEACIFGHTHLPALLVKDGLTFFNPGSAVRPWGGYPPSYGLLHIGEGILRPELRMIK